MGSLVENLVTNDNKENIRNAEIDIIVIDSVYTQKPVKGLPSKDEDLTNVKLIRQMLMVRVNNI